MAQFTIDVNALQGYINNPALAFANVVINRMYQDNSINQSQKIPIEDLVHNIISIQNFPDQISNKKIAKINNVNSLDQVAFRLKSVKLYNVDGEEFNGLQYYNTKTITYKNDDNNSTPLLNPASLGTPVYLSFNTLKKGLYISTNYIDIQTTYHTTASHGEIELYYNFKNIEDSQVDMSNTNNLSILKIQLLDLRHLNITYPSPIPPNVNMNFNYVKIIKQSDFNNTNNIDNAILKPIKSFRSSGVEKNFYENLDPNISTNYSTNGISYNYNLLSNNNNVSRVNLDYKNTMIGNITSYQVLKIINNGISNELSLINFEGIITSETLSNNTHDKVINLSNQIYFAVVPDDYLENIIF